MRHLWSTGRNWGTVHHRWSEEGAPQNRTVLVSLEPSESERQKYQLLGPLEKDPGVGANKGSVLMQDCSELQSWRLDKGATSGRKLSRARRD